MRQAGQFLVDIEYDSSIMNRHRLMVLSVGRIGDDTG